jgi:hypothetical protein
MKKMKKIKKNWILFLLLVLPWVTVVGIIMAGTSYTPNGVGYGQTNGMNPPASSPVVPPSEKERP